jgi:hypothetical protein
LVFDVYFFGGKGVKTQNGVAILCFGIRIRIGSASRAKPNKELRRNSLLGFAIGGSYI